MLPIILILLVGMLEFGMAYNDLLTIGYALREGARAGSRAGQGRRHDATPPPTDPGGVDKTVHRGRATRSSSPPARTWRLPGHPADPDLQGAPAGAQSGSLVNIWTYTPGAGPDVDPGPGTIKLDFTETSHALERVLARQHRHEPRLHRRAAGHRYRLTTPLGSVHAGSSAAARPTPSRSVTRP